MANQKLKDHLPCSKLDNGDHLDRDQKHRHRLHDALPLEAVSAQDSKVEAGGGGAAVSKESDKANVDSEGMKYSSDPTEVPRSRSYFQYDERGNVGQVGRSFNSRSGTERGWWRDAKEHQSESANRISTSDTRKKDERARVHGEGNGAWRHDRYLEMETEPKPLARRRPFREKKDLDDSEKADKAMEDLVKPNSDGHPVLESERRDERIGYNSRHADQHERVYAGDREANTGEAWRGNFSSRDQFTGRSGYRPTPTGGRVEKWKHDLYDEANRSPSPKNEEDAVAKVEALLAS